jgi:dTDP-4-amino-4,6-dideoxygalactose transaminase
LRVPFVDLHAQYLRYRGEIDAAISGVIARSEFIGGAPVREFERAFARESGVAHCVACGNGTDAIYVVLKMLGIGIGDEVITTAHSWISTSETISQTGARVVFADVDDYYGINVAAVERAVTSRTRAVIAVHLYGQAAEVDRLKEFCDSRGLFLIEDCAQSHLAERGGLPVGTFGEAATFSFYPGKNLGAYGDAGAIVTNNSDLALRCRMYAGHGAIVKHRHEIEGINSRLDGLQAAILSAKLPYLRQWTRERQLVAARYDEMLGGLSSVEVPARRPGSTHVYHLYVIQCERRNELREFLAVRQVETAIHYPAALPLLPAYAYLGGRAEQFPRAARNQERILSLPIYAEMSSAQIDHVVASIREFYGEPAI